MPCVGGGFTCIWKLGCCPLFVVKSWFGILCEAATWSAEPPLFKLLSLCLPAAEAVLPPSLPPLLMTKTRWLRLTYVCE